MPWGNVIEDFLEPLGLTLDTYCETFRGSWIFGTVDALAAASVPAIIVVISRAVSRPTDLVHQPTGAPLLALPPPSLYRTLDRRMSNPYARRGADTFGLRGPARLLGPLLEPVRELSPYVATPIRLLTRELRRRQCAVLVCQEYEFPRFDVCVLASRLGGVPVVGRFEGGDYQRWRLERLTRPFAVRSCRDLVIASADERRRVAERYRVAPERMHAVPNAVDTEVWRPRDREGARTALGLPLDARVVAWHGRVQRWKKGLDLLLDAWERLLAAPGGGDLRLLLVGDGPDADEIEARLARSGLRGVLFLRGLEHDPGTLAYRLAAADVYAFPSRQEGFPVAPIEAMACGLPVVAADVSGIRELLPDGEQSGGIVVPCDSMSELVDCLRLLLDDPERARAVGRAARARAVDGYSLESVGERLRHVLFGDAVHSFGM